MASDRFWYPRPAMIRSSSVMRSSSSVMVTRCIGLVRWLRCGGRPEHSMGRHGHDTDRHGTFGIVRCRPAGRCSSPAKAVARGLPDLYIVEASRAINQCGDDPTGDEDANDHEAKVCQVVVETANDAPEPTFEAELVADQPERFDTANEDGNDNGRRRNRQVIPELADRVDEGPA